MDTSKKYVKMCGEAEEIQGDVPLFSKRIHSFFWADNKIGGWNEVVNTKTKEWIWLPRQDQLQKIFGMDCNCNMMWLHQGIELERFTNWLCNYEQDKEWESVKQNKTYHGTSSWEQVWLQLVMKKKYNKRWDNEKEKWS